ncbi:MAG: hypothetical protein HRU33_25160 [Rhodobacteraceae bacterium]|nr:hypothetical protein [Paracoccaceae bacterium]
MEALILSLVGLSSLAIAHLLALRRRFLLILIFLAVAGGLYAVIRWYVGVADGLDRLVLAIFAGIAVVPFAAGLVLGAITGYLHLRWRTARGST